nr:hypothetical protein [uncultured Enterobacter sp.]
MTTAVKGQQKVLQKLVSLGARGAGVIKEGKRSFITFVAPNGKQYEVTTRAKTSGTWQTTTSYGKACAFNRQDHEYWIFVDLSCEPAVFYIAPLSWMRNDIYENHVQYLAKHNGHRALNEESTHHAISAKRIEHWKDAWVLMGF